MSLVLRVTFVGILLFHVQGANADSELSTITPSTRLIDGLLAFEKAYFTTWNDSYHNSSQMPTVNGVRTSIAERNIGASSSRGDPTIFWQYQAAVGFLTYGSPPLLVLATVGNTMSIIILQQPTFRKSSTSFILSALALVDLLYVDVGLTRQWLLNSFNYDLRLNSPAACKTHIFFIQFMQVLSPWTLVLLTAERFISVWKPLTCKELCSRQRIFIVWVVMVIVALLLVVHFFFAFDIYTPPSRNTAMCFLKTDASSNPWFRHYYLVAFISRTAIPFIILLSSNVFIVFRIIVSIRQRMNQMQAARSSTDKINTGKIPSSTVTMIIVSIVFFMLQIPNDIYTLKATISGSVSSTPLDSAIDKLFFNVMVFLSYLNSSINFINYFVTGRKFRQAAIDSVMCRWRGINGRAKEKPDNKGRSPAAAPPIIASSTISLSKTTTSNTSDTNLQE